MIRKAISLLLLTAMLTFLIPAGMSLANGPSLDTDKDTYDTGEPVQIIGTGFPYGVAVTISFLKDGNVIAILPTLQYGPDFTCAYTPQGWDYGEYTIRATYTGGGPVYATFTLAPAGKLVTEKDKYSRGAVGTVFGTEFPVGPAITLSVIRDSTTFYIMPTLFYGPTFTATFPVGLDWDYGTYYVRATYAGGSTKMVLSNPFEVVPGLPAQIVLTQDHDMNIVGEMHNLSAYVTDQYGFPVADGTLVNFVVDRAGKSGSNTTVNGVATYSYTVTFMAGDNSDEIFATALPEPAAPPVYSNTLYKTWLPGPPASVALTQEHSTNTVGENHNLTASVADQYGNPVADGTLVNFVVDRAGKSGSNTTVNGVATYSYTVTFMAGDNTDSIYATAGSIISNTLTKTWLPGPLHHFIWNAISSPQVAGVPFAVTITGYDQYENLAINFTGTANLTASNDGVSPATTGNFVAGVWTGNVTLNEPGNDVSLIAQSGAATGTSSFFDVHFTVTLHLKAGWNLVSLPVVTDGDPFVVFAGLPSGWTLFSWNPATGNYRDVYHTTIAIGQAFWLYVPADTVYQITGPVDDSPQIEIAINTLGWHLIGNPYWKDVSWDEVLVRKGATTVSLDEAIANGWIHGAAFYWEDGAYHSLMGGDFQTTSGYWFYAKQSGVSLIFPKP